MTGLRYLRTKKAKGRAYAITYLRRSAAILLTTDMDQMTNADDRRELETAARALEAAADEIENGNATPV